MSNQSTKISFIYSMKGRLLMFFLAVSIIPMAIVGFLLYNRAETALEAEASAKLVAVRDIKANQIEDYLDTALLQMEVFARSQDVATLFSKLREYHFDTNVQADGAYDVTTEAYQKIYEDNSANINRFWKDGGFYDIFMICAAHGHVMFS